MLEYLDSGSPYDEPRVKCPSCGGTAYANWVSVYQHPYEVQVEPFRCACGWVQECPNVDNCPKEKCKSYVLCKRSGNI